MARLAVRTAILLAFVTALPTALIGQTREVLFIGNDSYNARTIERVVDRELERVREERGSIADLVDAAHALESWYTGEGFPDVRVRFRMVDVVDGETERVVTTADGFAGVDRVEFLIDEGPRLYLGEVAFEGNDAFDDELLRAYVPRRGGGVLGTGRALYRPEDLGAIASSVRQHYLLSGYLTVRLEAPLTTRSENEVDVVFPVREGQLFRIAGVEVTGSAQFPDAVAREIGDLLPDSNLPYVERIAADGADRIERYLGRNGYFTDVRYRIVTDEKSASVVVHYEFSPVRRALLGEIRVQSGDGSDLRTRPEIVRNRFPIEPGDPIDRSVIERGRQELYQTGLFRIVSARIEEGVADGSDEDRIVDLVISIQEDRNRYLELAAGWGTVQWFTGSIQFVDENILGTGRLWGVEAAGSFIGYRLSTRVVDRFLLGFGSRLELRGGHEYRSRAAFSERSTSVVIAADVGVSETIRTAADYEFSYAFVDDLTSGADEREVVRLSTLNTALSYDTVDNALFPQTGTRADAGAGVAGVFLVPNISFARLGVELTRHMRLGDALVLSVQGEGSVILPFGGNRVPISERLYAGGGDSVRSFAQDELSPVNEDGLPVGGLTRVQATVETRVQVAPNFYIALFYDVGTVAAEPFDLGAPGHAIGVGLRYRLPIGPLRLDFAVNPGLTFAAENAWALHFSVGSGF